MIYQTVLVNDLERILEVILITETVSMEWTLHQNVQHTSSTNLIRPTTIGIYK